MGGLRDTHSLPHPKKPLLLTCFYLTSQDAYQTSELGAPRLTLHTKPKIQMLKDFR